MEAAAVAPPAFKVNIDFKFVRDNLELVKNNAEHRKTGEAMGVNPELVVSLYDKFCGALQYNADD